MPKIPYTASNFGRHWGPSLSGHRHLDLTWNELVWAAITMGKPGIASLLAHGWHSISDLVVRSHTVYANLREDHQYIQKSNLYASLVPTEKSGVSYFMGMLAAKVLGARLLDVPWLFHLSMIDVLGENVILKGNSEPDLIGLRSNWDWVVTEAKGRTRGHSESAMASAKLQTRQLRTINGQFPSLRIAVQASFSPRLLWAIEDPEEFDDGSRDLKFDAEDALAMYYSASISATESGQERIISGRNFVVREIEEIGVSIGIDKEARGRVIERTMSQSPSSGIRNSEDQLEQQEFVIFSDGLAIALDERWSEARMNKDPWSRRNG